MYSVTPLSLPYSQSSTQFLHLLQPSLQSLHNCSGNFACTACRRQMPEVNAVGNFACNACQHCMQAVNGGSASSPGVLPFRKAINRSGSGEILRSLPGPSLFVCACWLPDAAPPRRSGQQLIPDGSPPQRLGQQLSPDGFPPQRPGQQQTSFGGEEYSGLASNLAHLGRIC